MKELIVEIMEIMQRHRRRPAPFDTHPSHVELKEPQKYAINIEESSPEIDPEPLAKRLTVDEVWKRVVIPGAQFPTTKHLTTHELYGIGVFLSQYHPDYTFFPGKKFILGCYCYTPEKTLDKDKYFMVLTLGYEFVDACYDDVKDLRHITAQEIKEFYEITHIST